MGKVPSTTYTIIVDDNFHYQDPEHRYEIPGFASVEAAVAKCRSIVDACLKDCAEPGHSAEEIVACYKSFGEDP